MKTNRKLFYEIPSTDSVELKLEGVIAMSNQVIVSGSTPDYYDSGSIFGNDEEDW